MTATLSFDDWLRLGVEAGWVTPEFCLTHDGVPYTVEEEEAADDPEALDDHCVFALRLLEPDANLAPFYQRWGTDVLNGTHPLRAGVAESVRTLKGY